MKQLSLCLRALCIMVLVLVASLAQAQQPTIISYQGVITNSDGSPGDGSFRIAVSLWAADTGGEIWTDEFVTQVTHGVFNIGLGSGKPLPPSTTMDKPLWVSVSINGTPPASRQRLTAVPLALNVADGSITSAKLATDYVGSISVNGQKVTGRGTTLNIAAGDGLESLYDPGTQSLLFRSANGISGKGAKPENMNAGFAWGELGNFNISAPTNFIGTTDTSTIVEIHIQDGGAHNDINRVMHAELQNWYSPNIIWGYGAGSTTGNYVYGQGSVILGGGKSGAVQVIGASGYNRFYSAIGGGLGNRIFTDSSVIAGGSHNKIDQSANTAFIGGGLGNTILGGGYYSGIASGSGNYIFNPRSFIGSGIGNQIGVSGDAEDSDAGSAIAGGISNYVDEGMSFIGAGEQNRIVNPTGNNPSEWSSIVGGYGNIIQNRYDAILGGMSNLIDINGEWNSIGGGYSNIVSGNHVFLGGGNTDSARGYSVFLGGGKNNSVGWSVVNIGGTKFAVLSGGELNTINGPNADHSSITGGYINTILGQNNFGVFIGGGHYNSILGTNDSLSSIVGGLNNRIDTGGGLSVIAGGSTNRILDSSWGSFISGGSNNLIDMKAALSSIAGGSKNTIRGDHSVISGGDTNTIDSASSYSAISGGRSNEAQGPFNNVSGGEDNHVIYSDHSSIGGGQSNIIENPSWGVIGGGLQNRVGPVAWSSVIAGGDSNTVHYSLSFLGGGWHNIIGDSIWPDYGNVLTGGGYNKIDNAAYSVLVGGEHNFLLGEHSVLGGGYKDTIHAVSSFLGGGILNIVDWGSDTGALVGGAFNKMHSAKFSFLGGGRSDTIFSPYGVLGGGQVNMIDWNSSYSVLGGGDSNAIHSATGTIAGGRKNLIDGSAAYSTISGGDSNRISALRGTIAGGQNNTIASPLSTVGGGFGNMIMSDTGGLSVIAGGGSNRIDTNAYVSAISGGLSNRIRSTFGTISGGAQNLVDQNAQVATVGGGLNDTIAVNLAASDTLAYGYNTDASGSVIAGGVTNVIRAPFSTIGGGTQNLINVQWISACDCSTPASVGTIAGGVCDTIGPMDKRWYPYDLGWGYASPIMGSIGGGLLNTVNGMYGAVGGGYKNHALGLGATIPGGVGLEALDYQTVVGRYNKSPQYSAQLLHVQGPGADTLAGIGDAFTFVVGNGTSADSAHRHNGFTVSDNGHATAYDSVWKGAQTITGTIYANNTIIAWGNVAVVTMVSTLTAGIGCSVMHMGVLNSGHSRITLNVTDPSGGPHSFTAGGAAIVATVCPPLAAAPGMITATTLTVPGNFFDVYTFNGVGGAADIGFQFHVVAN